MGNNALNYLSGHASKQTIWSVPALFSSLFVFLRTHSCCQLQKSPKRLYVPFLLYASNFLLVTVGYCSGLEHKTRSHRHCTDSVSQSFKSTKFLMLITPGKKSLLMCALQPPRPSVRGAIYLSPFLQGAPHPTSPAVGRAWHRLKAPRMAACVDAGRAKASSERRRPPPAI